MRKILVDGWVWWLDTGRSMISLQVFSYYGKKRILLLKPLIWPEKISWASQKVLEAMEKKQKESQEES